MWSCQIIKYNVISTKHWYNITFVSFPEFPPEEEHSQDESALEDTMESELTEEDDSPKKSKKRKAAAGADKKVRKVRRTAKTDSWEATVKNILFVQCD